MDKVNTSEEIFEIRDEEINVEKIMEKIRENIKKRKEDGDYKENELEIMSSTFSAVSSLKVDVPEGLEFIRSCDICNEGYTISSHRPVFGKFLVQGRKMVHGEIRRYVDPMFQKQRDFNFNVAQVLKNILGEVNSSGYEIEHLNTELENSKNELENSKNELENLRLNLEYLNNEHEGSKTEILNSKLEIENLINEIEHSKIEFKCLKTEVNHLKTNFVENIKSEVNDVISAIDMDLDNKAWFNSVLENRLKENLQNYEVKKPEYNEPEINYYVFEERFRGSRDNIQQHQKVFLNYFMGCTNVLDIGCGRGEFLELASHNGIVARGIDIDEDMISFCKSKGFDVDLKDAVEALEGIEDKSLDGIFISQVVEHLAPDYLIKMLNLCNKKLKYGFYLVVETVNPLSLFSFSNFYIDLTHIKPVHPETLRFLFNAVDFREIDTKFVSPVPDSMRLKKLPEFGDLKDREKLISETYNQNIDMLNNVLYGAQDYAIIGKK